MESLIKIAGKELPVHVSIRTIIDYKSTFGTDIFEDLEKIQNVNVNSIGSGSIIDIGLFKFGVYPNSLYSS